MNLLPMLVQREMERGGRAPGRRRWFLGIDLGTTNSTAALVDAEAVQRGDSAAAVRLVPVRQITQAGPVESPLFPSCVAETSPGHWEVGLGAKEALRQGGLVRGRRIFYSTKSEMGLGREPFYPFAASRDFDCPYKVAGRVLAELRRAVSAEVGEEALANLVITIPASFQLAARKDTLRAAALAGLTLTERGLFDEPNAALLDYLFTVAHAQAPTQRLDFSAPRLVLVFDFGGGTCDISIVRVQVDPQEGRLNLANVAISRYERLGGDNIDTAIAETLLLPEFLRQNQLDALDFGWSDKRNRILPQLVDVAEALKLGLCAEYSVQLGLHAPSEIKRDEIVASQPSLSVKAPSRLQGGRGSLQEHVLANPTLTLEQFEQVLQPFLDQDLLYMRETEFNTTTSIFAPIRDALERAALEPQEIDAVLLVGGSSLIPQAEQALQGFFSSSQILKFPTADQTQFAVARGAALQSFFLHGLGRPLIRPIAQETIGILVQGGGFYPLIRAGTELPYPADGSYAHYDGLTVPHDSMRELEIVLAADNANKVLGVERLEFSAAPPAGEAVYLQWRLDANKMLEVRAWLPRSPTTGCELTLENPLCSTGFQSGQHRHILELEQQVAEAFARKADRGEVVSAQQRLAWLYLGLERYERAIDWARAAMRDGGRPHAGMLLVMGRAYGRLGALDREEERYREAVAIAPGDAWVRFSLSACLARQGRLQEALSEIETAMSLDASEGAFLTHQADILQRLGRKAEAHESLRDAAQLLDKSGLAYEYQRSWRLSVAQHLGDTATIERLGRMRQEGEADLPYDPAKLPTQRGDLAPGS